MLHKSSHNFDDFLCDGFVKHGDKVQYLNERLMQQPTIKFEAQVPLEGHGFQGRQWV